MTHLDLIAPPSGSLALRINGSEVTIDGPGTYTYGNGALAKGTDLPAPSCGGQGQHFCEGTGMCRPWFTLVNFTDENCQACGDDGQPACFDADERCKPGLTVSGNICSH